MNYLVSFSFSFIVFYFKALVIQMHNLSFPGVGQLTWKFDPRIGRFDKRNGSKFFLQREACFYQSVFCEVA